MIPYTPPVHGNVDESQPARYSALCKRFQRLGAIGSCSKPRYDYVFDLIEKGECFVNENFAEEEHEKVTNETFHEDGDREYDPVLDPPRSQTKGRKKAGRFKSGIETPTSKSKPRMCRFCKEEGVKHDRRNCPLKPK